ncbi:hypothetical protein TNCV_2648941 [Trichonephila clavipes]|nr:hypothetical protein TNCV_2648941 [Trichonephila clavipes]
MLPEDKLLRAVIRGLPTDMSPTQIIADLESQGFHIKDFHNMQSKKTDNQCPSSCSPWKGTRSTRRSSKQSRA